MKGYSKISAHTLCACSALPYIEEPVRLGSDIHCEGTTIDTVNFEDMLHDHPDLVLKKYLADQRQPAATPAAKPAAKAAAGRVLQAVE